MERLTEIKKVLKQVERDNCLIMLQEKFVAFQKRRKKRQALYNALK